MWLQAQMTKVISLFNIKNKFLITIDFDIHFKRKINYKEVTQRFDDSMSSLSNVKKISMNW